MPAVSMVGTWCGCPPDAGTTPRRTASSGGGRPRSEQRLASRRACSRFARSSAMADLGTHSVSSSSARPRPPLWPRSASAALSAASAAFTLACASSTSLSDVFCCAFWRRRVALFQRFLTAFSERPGSSLAILVQLLPHLPCASTRIASSSSVQPPFFRDGSRWLNQRSRHCLPMRPGMRSATSLHLPMPASMQSMTPWSSSLVHGPLMSPGARTFCQRWRHCVALRWPPRYSAAMSFQFCGPNCCTAARRRWSSSFVHRPPPPKPLTEPPPDPAPAFSFFRFWRPDDPLWCLPPLPMLFVGDTSTKSSRPS